MSAIRARLMSGWTFFRISLEERLVYRGDFMLGTLMRFLPIVTQIFLWWAIFESSSSSSKATIAGYTREDMIAYYLLAMVSRAFSSMPGLTGGIALQIQTGEIKKFLIQPIDMLGCLLLQRTAHKLVYYVIAAIPFALVFYLCRDFFTRGWPPMDVLVAFVLSLVMAFLMGFFIEACIGLVGFWFLEITSLAFVYMLLNFFLSGHMFPLDLLTTESVDLRVVVEAIPLKYLADFPAAIFIEKIPRDQLAVQLAIEAVWLLFFILLSRILWARGVRRYSGFGG
ncbi:MAG: ABC-2 family transporter protein [Planctomycetota bacterium]|nr:ABC-2 family transporter protein [Planctomycetota bacterium]